VRLRSKCAKNCGSRKTTLAMVYTNYWKLHKSDDAAQGFNLLTLVVNNVTFKDDSRKMSNQQRKRSEGHTPDLTIIRIFWM